MFRPLQTFWVTLRDFYDDFVLLVVCNVLWSLISLPLATLAWLMIQSGNLVYGLLTSLIAVLPMAPATRGLYHVTHRISEGRVTPIAEFFRGMRVNVRETWLVLGLWILGFFIIVVDIGFYANMGNLVSSVILGLWFYLLVLWLGILIYLFPLMFLQEQPNIRTLGRNALIMSAGRPGFTLPTLLLMSVVFGISVIVFLPLPLMTFSLLAQWSTRATQALINRDRERQEAAQEKQTNYNEERGRRGQVRPK